MRRAILIPALAALALGLAAGPALAERGDHHEGGGERGRFEGRDRGGGEREHGRLEGRERGGFDGRPERGERVGERGERRDERWDDHRNNGYWFGNRWFFGPPPSADFDRPDYRPGYSEWRRGGYLPPYYNSWGLEDYWTYHLRRPPRGYHWIQIGGDFLLVSESSGLIFDVIIGER